MNKQLTLYMENENKTDLEIKKESFLNSIKSKNLNSMNKYKRLAESPIRKV